jgi:hypothetical protein
MTTVMTRNGRLHDGHHRVQGMLRQPLLDYKAPATLNLKEHNITSVLWATGWNADLSWLQIDSVRRELGPHGRPESYDTSVLGFFWLGFHWLRSLTEILLGVRSEDRMISNRSTGH